MDKAEIEASIPDVCRGGEILTFSLMNRKGIRIDGREKRNAAYLGCHSVPFSRLLFVAVEIPCLRSGVQNDDVERGNSNKVAISAKVWGPDSGRIVNQYQIGAYTAVHHPRDISAMK